MPQIYPFAKPSGRFLLRTLFFFITILFSTHSFARSTVPTITWVGLSEYTGYPSRTVVTTVKSTINIIGTNFTGVTAVTLGGTPAESFTVISDTQIKAVVARETKAGYISITGPGGTSAFGSANISILAIPYIDGFTPTSGTAGTLVTIKGFNFSHVTAITIGDTPAASYTVTGDSTIEVIVGTGSTGVIKVYDGSSYGYKNMNFTYNSASAPIPQMASLTPASGTTGTTITIKGFYFTGATAVSFGGTAAASFTVVSDTVINAVVAAGTNSGSVSVTTAGGTASIGGFTYVVPDLKPHISSFTPASAAPTTIVTIKGINLSGATAVSFGGIPAASFSVTSDTTVNAEVSYGATGFVKVVTPGGVDSLGTFTFIPAAPAITWVGNTEYNGYPQMTAMTTVKSTINIIGRYFTGATAVTLGGTPAESFTVISDTQIKAVVARETKAGYISITGPGGTSKNASASIAILAIPYIDGFTPTSGTTGTLVTIKGFNFSHVTAITIGDTPAASYTVTGDSTIEVIVGTGSTGKIKVYDGNSNGGHNTIFTYNSASAPIPQMASLTPASGTTGTTITIKGFYFTGATAVSFGGTAAASFTVVSDTVINAVVAAGTNSGSVSVTTAGGTASIGGFTYVIPDLKPQISSFTPASAASGTVVTIKGSKFYNVTSVSFGGTPASSFTVNDSVITAQVGSGATGVVKVITNNGSDTMGLFTYMANMITAPSPATGSITVTHPVSINNAAIKLTNSMGNMVQQVKILPGNGQTRLDLSGVAPGIYLIWWGDGANTFSKTILIR